VKVFLDECVDWRLARDVVGHDVKTARQMGWMTVKNGASLTLASQHFDVFVTVDRNLSFQQNLDGFSIAVVVLQAKTNRLADLRPLVPGLLRPSSPRCRVSLNSLAPTDMRREPADDLTAEIWFSNITRLRQPDPGT
jgi:hypothetical protein